LIVREVVGKSKRVLELGCEKMGAGEKARKAFIQQKRTALQAQSEKMSK